MAYRLEVRSVRSIVHADLMLADGITLICGQNGAGKSSLCTVLGAVLANSRAPVTGKIGDDAKHLCRRGEVNGWASLRDPNSLRRIEWSAAGTSEVINSGNALTVSPIAAGLQRFSDLDDTARYALLARLLGALPTIEDLRRALPDAGKPLVEHVAMMVEVGAWDDALSIADAEAKQAMGAWREITGTRGWTAKQGENWEPAGLARDPAQRTEQQLVELRENVKVLNGRKAALAGTLTAEQMIDLRSHADELDLAVMTLGRFEAELAEADRRRQAALLALASIPVPGSAIPVCACPSCGAVLDVSTRELKLVPDGDPTADEVASRHAVYAAARKEETIAQASYLTVHRNLVGANGYLERCKAAAAQLAEQTGDRGGDQSANLADILQQLAHAQESGVALGQWLKAKAKHTEILAWNALRDQCKPEGLRREVLRRKLSQLNDALTSAARPLPGLVVQIDEQMQVSSHGVDWRWFSGSEKWLADVVLHLAIAELEKAPIIVVDGADVLTEAPRGRLLSKLLGAASKERAIVVAVAINKREWAPDFDELGFGSTYWVSDGRVSLVSGEE